MMNKKAKWDFAKYGIQLLSFVSIAIIFFIFIFVFYRAWPALKVSGIGFFTQGGFDTQIQDAFNSESGVKAIPFGMLGLILGTLLSTGIALGFATLLGIGASVTICEFLPAKAARLMIALVRLLASIPSVLFGLIGLIIVVPIIEKLFITTDLQIAYLDQFQMSGQNLLAAVIVLIFMIVPTIVSLSVDAIKAVPKSYRETGFAFGMTRFRVIKKIVLPSARSGIIAGVILGAGRGIGEAIAVSMVCGGLSFIPNIKLGLTNLLAPTLPLAAAIVNKSEAMGSAPVEAALFSCGALLLLMGAALSIGAGIIEKRMRKAAGYNA
ncbi:MAG: phosphate ABC transporter permease subunit PstC [Clostridia bacterium]